MKLLETSASLGPWELSPHMRSGTGWAGEGVAVGLERGNIGRKTYRVDKLKPYKVTLKIKAVQMVNLWKQIC